MIPNIKVREPLFDFGSITTLSSSKQKISYFFILVTIQNKSPVPAILSLDLRERLENIKESSGMDCIEITPLLETMDDKDEQSIIKSINEEDMEDEMNFEENDEEDLSESVSVQSDVKKESSRFYMIKVPMNGELKFELQFQPKVRVLFRTSRSII